MDEDKTQDAFVVLDEKRFYCTGDVGELRPGPDGQPRLTIIDRCAFFFKLSQGEQTPARLMKQECLDFMKDNISDVMKSEDWATHLAGNAELLNEVLAHIAGVSIVPAPSGSAKRQRLE